MSFATLFTRNKDRKATKCPAMGNKENMVGRLACTIRKKLNS